MDLGYCYAAVGITTIFLGPFLLMLAFALVMATEHRPKDDLWFAKTIPIVFLIGLEALMVIEGFLSGKCTL